MNRGIMGWTMIDKLANAIEAAAGPDPDFPEFKAMARAAIEAMREPTREMIDTVMGDRDKKWRESDDPETFLADWHAAIDAALGPKL